MLNLNYNINKAIGAGGCIGVMKYNYSASIEVYGGGGGGGTSATAGGGGGGGMYASRDISIVPNCTYQINVGGGGAIDADATGSSVIGFDDDIQFPIEFYAGGGKKGVFDGGNSGTGSIVRAGVVIQDYTAKTGGTGAYINTAFGPQYAAGGGASNTTNGTNGSVTSPNYSGGQGASGQTAGGGGGAYFAGPTGPYGNAGDNGGGIYGKGGQGYSNIQQGQVNPRQATAGSSGAVVITYSGKPKAIVTNATTTYNGSATTHIFATGSGTFLYINPYPWEQPSTPYQVVKCPPLYQ